MSKTQTALICSLLWASLFFLPAKSFGQNKGKEAPRPNIILIMADDMGYSDIGCFGGEIQTPNLNKLAKNGVRFTQFYNTARCCPTRASLLSGLYPHQAGVGWMTRPTKHEGYQGQLNRNCVTIAEALRMFGYVTYMVGKWHLSSDGKMDKSNETWPLQRGFDHFFGTITGAGNYFDPNTLVKDNTPIKAPKGFYYTDAISDNAAKFIKEHPGKKKDQPFFLYVAYTSPHWPLHALKEDIEKYKGKYTKGWDALRLERHKRMKEMGIVDAKWKLSEPDSEAVAWEKVPEEKKKEMAEKMAIYAAQIDRMDQGIGRILSALEETNQMDNTLIVFLADNGGCAEGGLWGFERMAGGELGTASSFASYGLAWAMASNTPFRLFKHWVHAGGVSTPMIMHWPARIPAQKRGGFIREAGHLIDIMPTFLAAAGGTYPETFKGNKIRPAEGKNLLPLLHGKKIDREAIYWEHEGNRAVLVGEWKLAAIGAKGAWELYNVKEDRTETNDLAKKHPEKVKRLADMWEKYAQRAFVYPLNGGQAPKAVKLNPKMLFELKAGAKLKDEQAPSVANRAITIEATIGPKITDGVIVAQGGSAHGYALFVKDGKLGLALRRQNKLTTIMAKEAIPKGSVHVAGKLGKDGTITLQVNGTTVATGKAPGSLTQQPVDGLQVGADSQGAVGEYQAPFSFQGNIGSVVIRLEK